MNWKRKVCYAFFILGAWALFNPAPMALAAESDAEVSAVRSRYEADLRSLQKDEDKQKSGAISQYLAFLGKQEKSLQSTGDLDRVLRVKNEREKVAAVGKISEASSPDFDREQKSFLADLDEITKRIELKEKELKTAYLDRLESMESAFTKNGKIASAIAARDERSRAAKATAPVAATEPPFNLDNPQSYPSPFPASSLKESFKVPPGRYRLRERVEFLKPGGGDMLVTFSGDSQLYGKKDIELFLGGARLNVSHCFFTDVTLRANLGGGATFSNCLLRRCTVGKGGSRSSGDFASRWSFDQTQIEETLLGQEWIVEDLGLKANQCVFKNVVLPSLNFRKTKVSEALGSKQLVVKNSRFIGCEIPLSFLLITEDCSFSGCTFFNDREAPVLDKAVTIKVREYNSNWKAKKPLENLTLEKISIADFQ